MDEIGVVLQCSHNLPALDIPELYRAIEARRSHPNPVRGKGHVRIVSVERTYFRSTSDFQYNAVLRGYMSIIRREEHLPISTLVECVALLPGPHSP